MEHDRGRRGSTLRDYRPSRACAYLSPRSATRSLVEITTADIDRWREKLVADGELSARTINKFLALLHGDLQARPAPLRARRPTPSAAAERQPEHRSGDFDFLEADEVLLLAAHAADEQDGALFIVAAFTGLRLGELLALRWSDVDFSKRLLHVRWSQRAGAAPAGRSRTACARCR